MDISKLLTTPKPVRPSYCALPGPQVDTTSCWERQTHSPTPSLSSDSASTSPASSYGWSSSASTASSGFPFEQTPLDLLTQILENEAPEEVVKQMTIEEQARRKVATKRPSLATAPTKTVPSKKSSGSEKTLVHPQAKLSKAKFPPSSKLNPEVVPPSFSLNMYWIFQEESSSYICPICYAEQPELYTRPSGSHRPKGRLTNVTSRTIQRCTQRGWAHLAKHHSDEWTRGMTASPVAGGK